MIKVEMTSKDMERETGIRHDNIMRDVKNKWLSKHPLDDDGVSLLKIEGSEFIVKTDTYTNSRGKVYPLYIFNKNAANAFMSNYKIEHSVKVVAYVNHLEKELLLKEKELSIMKEIVWDVINGQSYIGQEQALKMAGIKHPRLFMKYLKGNERFLDSVMLERNYLSRKQCNKHGDSWWKFTKEGFQWLLSSKDKINAWVESQKKLPA
jgi:hypothetical protein